jgi:ABC-type transport system involved in multi-copper enzyme maturation permease subunit
LILHSVLVLGTSAACLVLARVFLVRRAFAPPGNAVLGVFKRLDKVFLRLNDNPVTRGMTFVGDTARLPDDEPVAWRETAKRSLGKTRYLLRVFIFIELPVAAVCLMVIFDSYSGDRLSILLVPVGIVSVLMVSAQAASLIAGERSHQTLDVLCTTPLSGRDIIRQKFRAVQRLMLVLLVPLMTIFFFECAMRWNMPRRYASTQPYELDQFNLPLYLTCSCLAVAIYLPMFAWLSLYIGLRVKTQARAIMGSLAAIVAWCVAPLVFVCMPLAILFRTVPPESGIEFSLLLSPASIMAVNEDGQWRSLANLPWLAVAVNFAAYGLITLWLRRLCYAQARVLLLEFRHRPL